MRNILVTGGAGFIGSHLCKRLLDDGDYVFCLDNFYSSNAKNIEQLKLHPHFLFVNHDIINPIRYVDIDEIYHLACPASPRWYQKDPVYTIKTSVVGSINVLEIAKENNCKVLLSSTSEIYGDPLIHPQPETYWGNVNSIGIRSCYDESKRCAETLFFDYHRQYGVDIKVIRIFNTYGPNLAENDGRVISNFIIQALHNKDITIYGDGTQTRSFQYVDDLVSGMMLMMDSQNFTGPVNIGNPDEFTMLQLAEIIIKLTNSQSKIIFKDLPQDDPKQRRPDISLAKEKLEWEPKIKLEDGLLKTINYFTETLDRKI